MSDSTLQEATAAATYDIGTTSTNPITNTNNNIDNPAESPVISNEAINDTTDNGIPSDGSNVGTPATETSIEVPVDAIVTEADDTDDNNGHTPDANNTTDDINDTNNINETNTNEVKIDNVEDKNDDIDSDGLDTNNIREEKESDQIEYAPITSPTDGDTKQSKDHEDNEDPQGTELILDNGDRHIVVDSDNETDVKQNGQAGAVVQNPQVGETTVANIHQRTRVEELKTEEIIEDKINPPSPTDVDDTKDSKSSKCVDNSGNYIVYGLISALSISVIIGISINGANGVLEDSGSELGAIIGLSATNMILTPILLLTVAYPGFILTIIECSAVWVLLLTLIILLIDFIYFAIYLPQYSIVYILYFIMKVVLMHQFYIFANIDVKHYGSQIIEEFLRDLSFIMKTSQLIRLVPHIILIIIIQMVLFMLGCLVFVGGLDEMVVLKIIVFFLLVWSIKSLTHYEHIISTRVVTFAVDKKSRKNIKTNNSRFQQRLRSLSQITIKTSQKDGDDTETIDAAAVKTETVELAENGPDGKINASSAKVDTVIVGMNSSNNGNTTAQDAIQVDSNVCGNLNQDTDNTDNAEAGPVAIIDSNVNDDNTITTVANIDNIDSTDLKEVKIDIDNDNNTMIASKVEREHFEVGDKDGILTSAELVKVISDDFIEKEFDPIDSAFSNASEHVASIIIGSLLVTFSSIPNLLANLAQATKLLSRIVAVGCLCCAEMCDNEDGNGNSCCFISAIVYLLSIIAHGLEKIARFFLQYTHKMILTSSAFLNISYCKALDKQKRMLSETKDKFGSKGVLLDNALSQHITHLILLSSSLGAWITIWSGYPEYAPLIHIAGYLTGRTAFEMIDVILQLWLVIWHLEPSLLDTNEKIKDILVTRTVELIQTEDGKTIEKEVIEIEVQKEVNAVKTTGGEEQHIANKTEKYTLTVENGQSQTQEQGLAAVIGSENDDNNNNSNNNGSNEQTGTIMPIR